MKFSSTLAWYILYFTWYKVQPFLAMSNQDFFHSHAFKLETALTISLKKIPWRFNLLNGSRLYYNTIKCEKKLCLLFSYNFRHCLTHRATFMSKWHLIQPLKREIYKTKCLSPKILSKWKLFGHVTHPTKLVHMCLAYQHFHFSADWFSDNLHVSSNWYLQTRTKGKEFNHQFSRRSWGRNVWQTPKNVYVGG